MRNSSWIAIALALLVIVLAFGVLNEQNGVLGGLVGQDEGDFVGIRPIWNFTGTGVELTEDAVNNRMIVDLSAASGSPTDASYVTASTEAGLSAERVLTGTADRVTITDNGSVTGTITADLAATYAGQGTITTVGTIGTGVWQGTTVKQPYLAIGTGVGDANTLTLHDFLTGTPTDDYIPKWDAGGGNWVWEADATGSAGDITDVGDVSTGAAFTAAGTAGTSLYFYDAQGRGQLTIANLTQARTFTLPDATGEVSLLGQTIGTAETESGITLDSEWDTQGEVETVWGATLATDSELSGHTGDSSDPHGATLTQTNLTLSGDFKLLEAGGSPTLYGILDITDLTVGDKTYTFPNFSGTVITTGNIGTGAGDANTLTLHDLATGTPTDNYILKWDAGGGNWTWEEDLTGGGASHAILSATHTDTAAGSAVLGGIIAANATPTWQQVAGNTTTTQKFLAQTGTGAVSALPGWVTIADGDVPDILNITKISNLTSNGFVKTSGSDGTLSIDGATYLTSVTAHNLFSATHGDTVTASPVLGDIIYGNVSPAWTKLAGNTTATKKFLTQTGTGAVSAVPVWNGIIDGDLPSALTGKTYNGLTITTTAGTLTIANNASAALVTSGNYSITLTATEATNVTLPTTGTLSTLALVAAGTNGTAAANAGDDTTTARSDHEHYIYRDMIFFYSGTLDTGDPGVWIRLDEAGATGDIIECYAVLGTAGSTATTIDILSDSQTDVDGTPSWTTIFTNKLLIDANEKSTETASTASSLSVTSWTAKDHFRMNVDTAGTAAANATVKMKIRVKNKAS